jgi:mRNA-degrading endonuclease RelE of RelBE toxin-antitoxin system
MSSWSWEVVLEEPAISVLGNLDEREQHRFVQVLEELEADPRSHDIGGNDWWNSCVVAALQERGYPIRRIKARSTREWRIFYFLDDERRRVIVKEIVKKTDDTYGESGTQPEHVRRILDFYRLYFQIFH